MANSDCSMAMNLDREGRLKAGRREPRRTVRSFGRGLVFAIPAAILLWVLILWLV